MVDGGEQKEDELPLVTITGVNGYLGSHVCLMFLKSGEYRVRGTVRDKENERTISTLRHAFEEYYIDLEVVKVELEEHETIAEAIIGSTYVVHTAFSMTPDPASDEPRYQEEVQKQTQVIIEACRASGVKRLVVTGALTNMTEVEPADVVDTFDEDNWSSPAQLDSMDPFLKAKYT